MNSQSPNSQSDSQSPNEEFVALFVRHEAAIHSFVLGLVSDSDIAEEIVQQASVTMWRKFEQYTPGTSFRNWAFQVAKFTAMNQITKIRRDRHVFGEQLLHALAERATEQGDQLDSQRRALTLCVEKLSGDDREILTGCYQQGTSIKSFAEAIGQTPNAIYKRLNRIRGDLLRCIERRLGLESLA